MLDENLQVANDDFKPWGMEMKSFCMLMHISQLAGMIIPMAGLVMPIVMWLTNKEKSEVIDQHGKNIVNWIISTVIYAVGCFILTFVFIGVIGFIALAICSLIFTIMGAIKANKGEIYKYPLAISFMK